MPDKVPSSQTILLEDQKVWAPTYNDLKNKEYGFDIYYGEIEGETIDKALVTPPTDFAIANYLCFIQSSAPINTTFERNDVYGSYIFTSSAYGNSFGGSDVYCSWIGNFGWGDTAGLMYFGASPAMLFNL